MEREFGELAAVVLEIAERVPSFWAGNGERPMPDARGNVTGSSTRQ